MWKDFSFLPCRAAWVKYRMPSLICISNKIWILFSVGIVWAIFANICLKFKFNWASRTFYLLNLTTLLLYYLTRVGAGKRRCFCCTTRTSDLGPLTLSPRGRESCNETLEHLFFVSLKGLPGEYSCQIPRCKVREGRYVELFILYVHAANWISVRTAFLSPLWKSVHF